MTLKLILCILTVYLFVSCQTKDADVNISVPPQEKPQNPESEKNQDKEVVKTDELQELIDLSFEGKDKVKENDETTLLGKPLSQYIIDPKTDPVWKSVLEPTIQYYKTHLPELAQYIEKSMANVKIVKSPVPISRLRVRLLNENSNQAKVISRSLNHIWIDAFLFDQLTEKKAIELIQKEILIRIMIEELNEQNHLDEITTFGSWTEIFEKIQKYEEDIGTFFKIKTDLSYKVEFLIKLKILDQVIKNYTKNDFVLIWQFTDNLIEKDACDLKFQKRNNEIIVSHENNEIPFKLPSDSILTYKSESEIQDFKIVNLQKTYQLDMKYNKKSNTFFIMLSKIKEDYTHSSFENLVECEFTGDVK